MSQSRFPDDASDPSWRVYPFHDPVEREVHAQLDSPRYTMNDWHNYPFADNLPHPADPRDTPSINWQGSRSLDRDPPFLPSPNSYGPYPFSHRIDRSHAVSRSGPQPVFQRELGRLT